MDRGCYSWNPCCTFQARGGDLCQGHGQGFPLWACKSAIEFQQVMHGISDSGELQREFDIGLLDKIIMAGQAGPVGK